MTTHRADFAIVGSPPLARLVAGLLASAHGKSVVFIGESQSGYRLPRGMDLSVAPISRPESWALLKTLVPETQKLIGQIGGRRVWSRIDPVFFAEGAAAREALNHFRHMAQAFGYGTEPLSGGKIGAGRIGMILRDAILLRREKLEPALDRWLDQHGVARCPEGATLTVRADGSATLQSGDDQIEIGQTVLADDVAIMVHLSSQLWPQLLQRQATSTIITEPTRAIAAPVMHLLDGGVSLMQQSGGGIVAMGAGEIEGFAARLNILLGHDRDFRQAGQSRYVTIVTADAAPGVGRVGGVGPDVLAGLGPIGAFLAPAIARWLAGVATDTENAWFVARLVNRQPLPSLVGEIGVSA